MPVATSLAASRVTGPRATPGRPPTTAVVSSEHTRDGWRLDRRPLDTTAGTPAGHAGSYASERVGEQRRLELGRLASGLAPGLAPGLVPGLVPSPAASLQAAEMLAGGKPRRKKRRHVITANLSGTRYDIIRTMARKCGFVISADDDPNSYLLWNDSFVSTDRIAELKPYQRINHFPGMGEICRKDCLARNISKMARYHAEEYNFLPKTWILPAEYTVFQNYVHELKRKKKTKTFIMKPANGAMGNGITLLRNVEKMPIHEHMIVQEYVEKPLLIDGYKCDMRIYALVTSCDPLKVFLYDDGLLRMGTEKYGQPSDSNIDHLYMHLTNYSVNKRSDQYDRTSGDDAGSKRSLRHLGDYLRQRDVDVSAVWRSVTDVVVKALVVVLPHLLHAYRMCRPGRQADSVCFELLGFDIMLDRKLRPWLLEINRSPSFGTDEELDYEIKSGVVGDTLKLLNIRSSDKRKNIAAQKAQTQRRLLRPTKRQESGNTVDERKRSLERKKEELRELLARVRRDSAQNDFESRHCGRFRRIFPSDDPLLRERYTSLIGDSFRVFLCGRSASLQRQIESSYDGQPKEEDILDMIAQCEEETDGRTGLKAGRAQKALSSMPPVTRSLPRAESLEPDDSDLTTDGGESPTPGRRVQSSSSSRSRQTPCGIQSEVTTRLRKLGRHTPGMWDRVSGESLEHEAESLEREDEQRQLTRETLQVLTEMHIRFPGKTTEQAELILDTLNQNWAYHKPRVASYWLVKLDSTKRRKVIDIVRSNVRCVTQRVWQCADVEKLPVYRIFCRVFNRFLWSHGQGLWNCFQNSSESWEAACSRGPGVLSACERACCQRIVQLCRDCLLIIYQFATETKDVRDTKELKMAKGGVGAMDTALNSSRLSVASSSQEGWPIHQNLLSQRLSRLYQSRPQSSNGVSGST